MSVKVYYEILNQKGTPAFYSDTYANRPAFGFAGRVFISTDTGQIFEDTGSAWSLIADAGVGGGTLASVTANGNTTATGIVITAGGLSADSITDTALTTGSVLFSGAGGVVSQKNSNLFWDNTNNRLGIGNASPGAPLDIHSTGTNAQFNGTGTNNAYLVFQNAGTSKWRIGNTYNSGANSFDLYNNGTASTALSFNSTTNAAYFPNNVGIGTNTPAYPLDVNGQTRISDQLSVFASGSNYGLYVQGVSNQYSARIIGNATTGQSYGLNIQAGTNSSDCPLLVTSYSVGTPFLKVTGAGNVGINNSTPSLLFSVVSTDNTQNSIASFAANNLTQQVELWYGGIKMGGTAAAADLNLANKGAANMLFSTNSTERMRISSGGNVLLGGTTDTTVRLSVTGSTSDSSNFIFVGRDSGGNGKVYFRNDGQITFTNLGTGTVTATSGVLSTISDMNLKLDDGFIDNALDKVLKLIPRYFYWKEESGLPINIRQLGFYAQEVNEALGEEAANKPINNEKWGITDRSVIAMLTKAIQELNEKLVRNNIN